MKLSSLSCVICLAAIAVGEESQHQHQHLNINQSTTEPLIAKLEDHDHDHDHSGHDHHDHREDHNPDVIESFEVDNPARDYITWLAAGGKIEGFLIICFVDQFAPSGSITLISLCGVFGILVVPIMQRVLYQHLIQASNQQFDQKHLFPIFSF